MTAEKILITGATGNVGSHIVSSLRSMGVGFRALVRGEAKGLEQEEIVFGDLADEDGLVKILDGVDRVFLLTNSSEEAEGLQMNLVRAAAQANVKHIVKLSQLAADMHSPVRFLRYHAVVEEKIRAEGLKYTFLRPNLYMQGLLALKDAIKREGRFYAAVGDARISAVDVRDIAAVAVAALTQDGHEGKVYTITGPESLTHDEMAGHLSAVLGREISFVNVAPEQMAGAFRAAGFPEWQVGGLVEDYAHYARGEAAAVSEDVRVVTGKMAIRFEDFVRDYKDHF